MKLIISKEELNRQLQKVLGPATTKQNFPVLSGVKINCSKTTVNFTTTDLDITITTSSSLNNADPGEFVVPMKRFSSIVKELPSQEIAVELSKNTLIITCGKVEFKINTLNADEFPQSQGPKNISLIKLDSQSLEEMIRVTSFCVGYEDVNYVLNGILFEIEGKEIRMVATDGKRLAFAKRGLPANQSGVDSKISFILPIKAINELQRLIKDTDGQIYMFAEDNKVGFDFKGTQITARPIEGEFPDYEQYIPQEGKDKLTINRRELLSSLKRASILSTPEHQGVKFNLKKGSVGVCKSTPQLGEVKDEISATYSGAHLELGINPIYLIDVLKNVEDENACFDFTGPDKPVVFRKEGYVYLLLPMKI
jgi:DNA polymerase III subunit beta